MAYSQETEKFYQAQSTIVDSTPDGDTVKEGFVDRLTPALTGVYADINLLKTNGMIGVGVPATESGRGIARVATAAEVAAKKTSGSVPAFVTPENMGDSIKLNNTVSSTSTTEAATANAVKTAYDKAVSAVSEVSAFSAPKPQSSSGVGQWVPLFSGTGWVTNVTLPPGGTWLVFIQGYSTPSDIGSTFGGVLMGWHPVTGFYSGGTTIVTGWQALGIHGWAWRIA